MTDAPDDPALAAMQDAPADTSTSGPDPALAAMQDAPTSDTPAPTGSSAPSQPHPAYHPTRFQQAAAPPAPSAPEPSWGQVAQQAGQNLIPSAEGVGGAMLQSVLHPLQTFHTLHQLGSGLISQAAEAAGVQQDPQAAARAQALAKAVEQHYATTYGSVKGFKQAVSADPASILMDASTFLDGAGAAADAANFTRTAAFLRAANPVSAATKIATAIPVGIAKAAVTNPLTRALQSGLTGVPVSALRTAALAGAETNPALRATFNAAANGQVDASAYLQRVQAAVGAARDDNSAQYLANKAGLANQSVPLTGAYQKLQDWRDQLAQGSTYAGASQAAQDAAEAVQGHLDGFVSKPTPQLQNVQQADWLKRQLWDLHDSTGNGMAKDLIGSVAGAVKSDISAVDPAYADMMDQYRAGLSNVTDIARTFGSAGKNPAASAALVKGLRAMKSPGAGDLLQQISAQDPTIPYMLAGASVQPWLAGGGRGVLEAAMVLPWAAVLHNPLAIPAQAAIQSPRLAGALNYGVGAAGRVAGQIGSPALEGAYYAGRANQEGQAQAAGYTPGPTGVGQLPTTGPNDIDAATRMIIGEAGNQPIEGKVAALYTAINRAKQTGKSLADVIGQPNAYEAVTSGKTGTIDPNSPQYQSIRDSVVLPALAGQIPDPTNGMTHFINKSLQLKLGRKIPDWAQGQGLQIGQHTFYSAEGGRLPRASGGKVDDPEVERLVGKLMARAKHAKTSADKATKPLLRLPDEAVAKALSLAQGAI